MLCFLLCTSLWSLFRHWVEFFHPVKLWKKRFMDHKMWPEPLLMWWCTESGCTVPFKAGVFWTMKWSMQVSLVLTTLWWIVQRNEGKTLPSPTEEEAFLSVSAVLWQLEVWQSAAPPPRSHDHFLTSALWSHSVHSVLCRELNRNRIRQVEGLTFQGLSSLEVLKLQRNSISKLTDGAFWDLAKMKTLYVRKTPAWIIYGKQCSDGLENPAYPCLCTVWLSFAHLLLLLFVVCRLT